MPTDKLQDATISLCGNFYEMESDAYFEDVDLLDVMCDNYLDRIEHVVKYEDLQVASIAHVNNLLALQRISSINLEPEIVDMVNEHFFDLIVNV